MGLLFLTRPSRARGQALRAFVVVIVFAFVLLASSPSAAAPSAVPFPPQQLTPADHSYVTPPSVTFHWTATEGANWYFLSIFREDRQDEEVRFEIPATSTSFTLNTLDPGFTYLWNVQTDVDTVGDNYDFFEFTLAAQTIPPLQLNQIVASDGKYNDQVEVTWFRSLRATYYLLQRRGPGSANFEDIATVGSLRSYADKEPEVEVHYEYRVLACNSAGCSAPSWVDEGWIGACNPAPRPVLVSPAEGEEIRFTWQDPWYYLRWEPIPGVPGFWVRVWDVATGHTVRDEFVEYEGSDSLEMTGEAGHLAWNVIAANPVIGCPRGVPSETRTFTAVAEPPPPVPTNVQASDGAYPDKVVVTWEQEPPEDDDLESWNIWRGTSADPSAAERLEETFQAPPYEDTTVTPGTLYYYFITACSHGDGCSVKSVPDSGYAGTPPPVEFDFSYLLPLVGR